VVDDAILQNNHVSLGIEDVKSLISCFLLCIWLCFVVLQVIMFNIVFKWSGLGEVVLVME